MELRPWLRIRETTDSDDNPDVADYVGRGELRISRYGGDHGLVLQLRHSLRSGDRSRGSAQLEWAFPLSGALHGYLQVFGGHGESLGRLQPAPDQDWPGRSDRRLAIANGPGAPDAHAITPALRAPV
jgi:outer membrane phospholipase A